MGAEPAIIRLLAWCLYGVLQMLITWSERGNVEEAWELKERTPSSTKADVFAGNLELTSCLEVSAVRNCSDSINFSILFAQVSWSA
jgi:hypothetical protein